jgi:hypothetical protein
MSENDIHNKLSRRALTETFTFCTFPFRSTLALNFELRYSNLNSLDFNSFIRVRFDFASMAFISFTPVVSALLFAVAFRLLRQEGNEAETMKTIRHIAKGEEAMRRYVPFLLNEF